MYIKTDLHIDTLHERNEVISQRSIISVIHIKEFVVSSMNRNGT